MACGRLGRGGEAPGENEFPWRSKREKLLSVLCPLVPSPSSRQGGASHLGPFRSPRRGQTPQTPWYTGSRRGGRPSAVIWLFEDGERAGEKRSPLWPGGPHPALAGVGTLRYLLGRALVAPAPVPPCHHPHVPAVLGARCPASLANLQVDPWLGAEKKEGRRGGARTGSMEEALEPRREEREDGGERELGGEGGPEEETCRPQPRWQPLSP